MAEIALDAVRKVLRLTILDSFRPVIIPDAGASVVVSRQLSRKVARSSSPNRYRVSSAKRDIKRDLTEGK